MGENFRKKAKQMDVKSSLEKDGQLSYLQTISHLVSGKWRLKIVEILCHAGGVLRYNSLKRSVPDISHKVLIQTLRSLEKSGIISRMVFPEVPPKVEYSLTKRGWGLTTIIEAMNEYGKKISEESS